MCVCIYVYEVGADQWRTPYLGIALPPLLGVQLVLLQGGPGLSLQAAHLPLALPGLAVPLGAVLLLESRPLLLPLHALLRHLIGQKPRRQGDSVSQTQRGERTAPSS